MGKIYKFRGRGLEEKMFLSIDSAGKMTMKSTADSKNEKFEIEEYGFGFWKYYAIKQVREAGGKYLSHAFGELTLRDKIGGDGEYWYKEKACGYDYFSCCGKEKGKVFSHAFARLWLQDGKQGEGELWNLIEVK